MVHELAHQWFGDSVSIRRWRDLWLNEGFATYLEWWYAAAHGGPTRDAQMLESYRAVPPKSRWWSIPPGDPGPGKSLFRERVQTGAMTLQALHNIVGERDLGQILRTWSRVHRYGHGTTRAFIALAERISRHDLSRLFRVWLYRPHRPARTVANGFPARRSSGARTHRRALRGLTASAHPQGVRRPPVPGVKIELSARSRPSVRGGHCSELKLWRNRD